VLGQPPVLPVLPPVLLPDAPADVAAVDLDVPAGPVGGLVGGHRLAQLVRQDEGRLVAHVQVAAELERADPLGRVHEDRDGHEVVADGELPAMEGGAGRDGELPAAGLALEQPAGAVPVAGDAAAGGADRLAAGLVPAQGAEGGDGLLLAHARDPRQGEGAGLGGEEEVLGHRAVPSNAWLTP
jgi:hypothetical protein